MSIPGIQKLRQEQARRFHWTKGRLVFVVLIALFVLYVALGFWVAPIVARSQMQQRLTALLGREVTVDKVRVNPLALSVAIEGFAVAEQDGAPFAGWRRLFVNFESSSLGAREWRFKTIALEGLRARVRVGSDGRSNVEDVIQRLKAQKSETPESGSKEPWPVSVDELRLLSDPIEYVDESRAAPFSTTVSPIDFTLHRFQTSAAALADGAFSAQTGEGETFAWAGTVSLAPLRSSGTLEVKGIPIAKYRAFYGDYLKAEVTGGVIAAKLNYDLSIPEDRLILQVTEGSTSVEGLQVAAPGTSEPVLRLDTFRLEGFGGSTADNRFSVQSVLVGPGSAQVARNADGISLAKLIRFPEGKTDAAPVAGPKPYVRVGEVRVEGLGIHFTDTTMGAPAKLAVTNLNASVTGLDSENLSAFLPVTVGARLQETGSFNLTGEVSLQPLQWRAKLGLEELPLAPLTPVVQSIAPYAVTDGRLSVQGETEGSLPESGAPVFGGSGTLAVRQLNVVAADSKDPVLSLGEFALNGVEYVSQPAARLVIREAAVNRPTVDALIRADGTWNILPGKKASEEGPKEVEPPKPLPLSVAIDKVSLSEGVVRFRDQSITPEASASLEQFGGTIEGLSSEQLARAKVDLQGKVEGASTVSVVGQINPLSETAFTDLTVKLQGMDLSPFAPYIGKYAGRELSRGSANVDLNVHLSSRELDSKNLLVLDQFTLGQATNSKDATSLPVGLALALLRDREGKIVVDLPVQGRLDDPEFRIGRVVVRVFVNILTRAATSPFSLIGGMFGGGTGKSGEDLAYQDFAPGLATLDEDDVKELQVVATALIERPGLALDVRGSYDPNADAVALREVVLREQLKAALLAEMKQAAPPGAPVPDTTPELTPEGEARLLTKLYLAENSATAETPLDVPAPAEEQATEPTSESKNWIQRFFGFLSKGNTGSAPRASGPPTHQSTSPSAIVGRSVPPPDEIRKSLLDRIAVDEARLRDLAQRRATEVRAFLVNQGKAPADRIFIAPPLSEGTRVRLDLK